MQPRREERDEVESQVSNPLDERLHRLQRGDLHDELLFRVQFHHQRVDVGVDAVATAQCQLLRRTLPHKGQLLG